VLAIGSIVDGADLRGVRDHAPKYHPNIEKLRIEQLGSERCAEKIAQALARRRRPIHCAGSQRVLQRQCQRLIRFRDQSRLARKVMVDQSNGNARRGADAAHRNAVVSVFFQTPKSRPDQCFAAYRRRGTAELWYMPLFLHLIPFSPLFPFSPLYRTLPGVLDRSG